MKSKLNSAETILGPERIFKYKNTQLRHNYKTKKGQNYIKTITHTITATTGSATY